MDVTITGGSSVVTVSGTPDATGPAKATFTKDGVATRWTWQWTQGVPVSETVPLQPGTYTVIVEFNGISYCDEVTVPSSTSKVMPLCPPP